MQIPVLALYLNIKYSCNWMKSRALSYISLLAAKDLASLRPALNILIIRTLIAYQSLPDPMLYKNDHSQIIQLCTTPFRYWAPSIYGCVIIFPL